MSQKYFILALFATLAMPIFASEQQQIIQAMERTIRELRQVVDPMVVVINDQRAKIAQLEQDNLNLQNMLQRRQPKQMPLQYTQMPVPQYIPQPMPVQMMPQGQPVFIQAQQPATLCNIHGQQFNPYCPECAGRRNLVVR